MKTQTSLIAEQTRLHHWAEQITRCQSRPKGMSVDDWCNENDVTRANYYYRLKQVRKACLAHIQNQESQFIELTLPLKTSPIESHSLEESKPKDPVATLRNLNNLSLEIYSTATPELIQSLIGAFAYVK